jgi:hypothetical protein
MQPHASSQLHRELGALLAREDGRIHGQDVGALIGQAALAFEVPLAVAPFPPQVQEDMDDDTLATAQRRTKRPTIRTRRAPAAARPDA